MRGSLTCLSPHLMFLTSRCSLCRMEGERLSCFGRTSSSAVRCDDAFWLLVCRPQRASVQVLFDFTLCAGREFECSFGASLRRPRSVTATSIGAAFHGASSSADVVTVLKRAFWDLEDVLSSVGIAKSSCGVVCTDSPCCPEVQRNENDSLELTFSLIAFRLGFSFFFRLCVCRSL